MFDNEVTEIMNYYLDIETTGLDPLHAKIITIQYMELERNTAKPIAPLKILKEWESDEKTIHGRFVNFCDRPSLDEIPEIVEPTMHGMIEVMRGCGRGCKF